MLLTIIPAKIDFSMLEKMTRDGSTVVVQKDDLLDEESHGAFLVYPKAFKLSGKARLSMGDFTKEDFIPKQGKGITFEDKKTGVELVITDPLNLETNDGFILEGQPVEKLKFPKDSPLFQAESESPQVEDDNSSWFIGDFAHYGRKNKTPYDKFSENNSAVSFSPEEDPEKPSLEDSPKWKKHRLLSWLF